MTKVDSSKNIDSNRPKIVGSGEDEVVIIDPVVIGSGSRVESDISDIIAQRDEYRQHMERYQDEVRILKSLNQFWKSRAHIAKTHNKHIGVKMTSKWDFDE